MGARVYRGEPSAALQPAAARAFLRQARRWRHTGLVTVVSRLLRYPKGWPESPSQEKGIDVALAVDFVRLALMREYDVGIIFSSDTDLLPALETVFDLKLAKIEVAAWSKAFRLRFFGQQSAVVPPPERSGLRGGGGPDRLCQGHEVTGR